MRRIPVSRVLSSGARILGVVAALALAFQFFQPTSTFAQEGTFTITKTVSAPFTCGTTTPTPPTGFGRSTSAASGQCVAINVAITNNSTTAGNNITNVSLSDALPQPGLTGQPGSCTPVVSAGYTCTVTSTSFNFSTNGQLYTLGPSQTGSETFVAQVTAACGSAPISNTAGGAASGTVGGAATTYMQNNTGSQTATINVTPCTPTGGVTTQKAVSVNGGAYSTAPAGAPAFAVTGDYLTYQLSYNNSAATSAGSVTFTDQLQPGQTLVQISSGCTTNTAFMFITCTAPSVGAAGQSTSSGSFTITTRVTGSTSSIANTACYSVSSAPTTTSCNGSAALPTNTTYVTVNGAPSSSASTLQKAVSINGSAYGVGGQAQPGSTLAYVLTFTNNTGTTLSTVTFHDTLAAGQTPLASPATSSNCVVSSTVARTLDCSVYGVAPGAIVREYITTAVNSGFYGQIANNAWVTSGTTTLATSNTTVVNVPNPTPYPTPTPTPVPTYGNFTVCGIVATYTVNSTITINGITVSIAFGATISGTIYPGTNQCVTFVLNNAGQATAMSPYSNLAGVGTVCGTYQPGTTYGTILVNGLTVPTSTGSNMVSGLTPGAYYCFLLTSNGTAYAVLTNVPTAITTAGAHRSMVRGRDVAL